MIILTDLVLNNVVVYKKAHLKLNKNDLTRVYGLNLDKRQTNSSNACGKSLLFNVIGSILLNFVRTNSAKKAKNTIFSDKTSSAALHLEKNGIKYVITQYFKGSVKWNITKNGKSLKFRETKQALLYIKANILDISEQQFYSQIAIDGRSKTLLQIGTSKQRFEYFEEVFRLNTYDLLALKVNTDFNKLKKLAQELDILVKEIKEKEKQLPTEEKDDLLSKQSQLKAKFDKIRDKIDELLKESNLVNTFINISESGYSKKPLNQLLEEHNTLKTKEMRVNFKYKTAIKRQEKFQNYQNLIHKREKILAELSSIPISKKPLEQLHSASKNTENLIEHLQDKYFVEKRKQEINADIQAQLNLLRKNNENLFKKYENSPLKVIKKTIARNKVVKTDAETSLVALEDFITSNNGKFHCPTCTQKLDIKTASIIIDSNKQIIEKSAKNITKLRSLLQYIELKSKIKPLEVDIIEIKSQIEENEEKLNQLNSEITLLNRRKELTSVLNNLPRISETSEFKSPDIYANVLDSIKKKERALLQAIKSKQRLKKLNLDNKYTSIEEAKTIKANLEDQLGKYRPLIDSLQNSLSKINGKLSVLEVQCSDITRLQTIINQLDIKTKNMPVYEALRKAFGPKGLRKTKTVYFAAKLEENLNKYSSLIYHEPIVFKINVSNTKLDILAERNNKIDDVRSLSGAESSAFTLLMILCILPFIKSSDRLNILILDEIEIGFDASYKELFVNRFLPVLQQIVPNIFIISPQSEENFYIPNVVKLTVVKEKGVSFLKEGM